ncbi:ubiquitin fusion degradation protein [Maudiozyma exigua]|uniref:Ubiquitin fusion degradation protein 1 n=1 Tax=Maudiozyma exigua TaxID=34358 RepID=A0A9P6VZP4_MAUEX|nr:ubiquitin fusion degradation protein [Kazachstania exigua]
MFSGFNPIGGNGFVNIPQVFEEFFRCYPISMMEDRIRKDDANFGGKIFLPPSALNKLSMLNIRYPMLFKLTSNESGKITHCGVLEFIAEEGRAYLPQWMLETLNTQPGSLLKITSTDVPLGQFVKLEPQSVDFLDISDPKAVLENVLRNFSTLTVDDIIEISYNNKIFRIKILEVKPESESKSICVIETDLVTDFAPPVGYVEPDYKALQKTEEEKKKNRKFDPSIVGQGSMSNRINYSDVLASSEEKSRFTGEGSKLSGKSIKDYQLFFGFPIVAPKTGDEDSEANNEAKMKEQLYKGSGQSLRKSNKRKGKKDHTTSKATKAPRSPDVIEID